MKLLKLSYTTPDWELKDLELNDVNLIVAKNATGKSRTLEIFDLLIRIIDQQRGFSGKLDNGATWSTEFINNDGKIIKYDFTKEFDASILEEKLFIEDVEVLSRSKNEAWIKNFYDTNGNNRDNIYPPINKLILHTNRDTKKYPFLEDIVNWAENSYGFRFSNVIPSTKLNSYFSGLLNAGYNINIPESFNILKENNHQSIITEFNSIGYNVSEITSENINGEFTIYVKENSIEKLIPHWQLAQGMYRTLFIIVYFEYLITFNKPAMVVIDDLCEGLDFERATKLGKLIFEKCLNSNIQLIATSNDSFLMEVVDIKYWNILTRKGKVVTALNYKNNQKIFDDFRFTGLSNFDFFSSDYLKKELE